LNNDKDKYNVEFTTGKKDDVGNNVSHAMNKTKRKFSVNLVKKRFLSSRRR
jgi:ribosomal protein L28